MFLFMIITFHVNQIILFVCLLTVTCIFLSSNWLLRSMHQQFSCIRNKSNLYLRAWMLLFMFSIVAFHSFWPLNLDKFKIQININLFPIGGNEISHSDTVRRTKITRIELFKQKNKQRHTSCCYKAAEITLKKITGQRENAFSVIFIYSMRIVVVIAFR